MTATSLFPCSALLSEGVIKQKKLQFSFLFYSAVVELCVVWTSALQIVGRSSRLERSGNSDGVEEWGREDGCSRDGLKQSKSVNVCISWCTLGVG